MESLKPAPAKIETFANDTGGVGRSSGSIREHRGTDMKSSSGAPKGAKNGNYKHGRYTAEVAATRRWLREAAHMLRELKSAPNENRN
jgi:hypothetical protein